jgi:uncharacterized protein YcaQ
MAEATFTRRSLRRHAIAHSLFPSTTLQGAVDRLGFIQADPIRSPARAQDLILRHRVEDYRVGELHRQYPLLDVEEDYLYAYGFLARRVWQLLHPRRAAPLRRLERKVLDVVRTLGETHPGALEAHLGRKRIVNAWGGYSKATTDALEWLHWRGHLRIARRERGIRVYQPAPPIAEVLTDAERLRELALVHANIFAPTPAKSLQSVLSRYDDLGRPRRMVAELIREGELRQAVVGGVNYIWPAAHDTSLEAPEMVRFLAPFDPLVWDRARFEQFWGWAYRFEAYTPVKKRVRGYYAMPLLWRDDIIGWVNVTGAAGAAGAAALGVDVGFVRSRPRERAFTRGLDAEIARLREFLQ